MPAVRFRGLVPSTVMVGGVVSGVGAGFGVGTGTGAGVGVGVGVGVGAGAAHTLPFTVTVNTALVPSGAVRVKTTGWL